MANTTLSIVIPCYQEAATLPGLLAAYDAAITRNDIEIIVVNTVSEDTSVTVLADLKNKYERFLRVVHIDQRGYGLAIVSGLKIARGEFIGWTHGDMQAPPTDVLKALSIIENNGRSKELFVKGLRKKRPFFDNFFTLGMSVFESLYLKERLFDINAQPNIFHRDFFATWKNPPQDFSLDLYALYEARRAKLSIVRFPVFFLPRPHGHSSWNTGLLSRWRFIKRTLGFSIALKRRSNRG